MKKFGKFISCGVIAMTLIVSMQICAMASVTGDQVSSPVTSSAVASTPADSSIVAGSAALSDIAPYDTTTPNPRTGTQSLAIPGVVAMLAAATAAVTLAGKKK